MTNLDDLPRRTLLYYPTINIPTSNWLRQSLLYWDGLGSIVPAEFRDGSRLSPDLQFLMSEGFFKPYPPRLAFYDFDTARSFRKELSDIISSDSFQNSIPPTNERELNHLIYREKVFDELFSDLKRMGLAKSDNYSDDYLFEEKTFYIYMALLARYMCLERHQPEMLVAGTNVDVYQNLVFKTNSSENGTPSFELSFLNLLPVPRQDTPLDDILSFRHRRQDELLRFRLVLNQLQLQLKSCKSSSDARDLLANFQEEITVSLTDLRSSMSSDNIQLVLGALGSIVTTHLGELMKETFDPVTSTIPTLLGTIMIGYCLSKKFKGQDIVSKSPVSYLVHIQNEFDVS